MKPNNAGFTLGELMTAIAIIAILSAIAVPNMIGYRERAKFRGTFENLRGDLQWAKMRAIRDHDDVSILFDTGAYEIINAEGTTIRSRQLPAGVIISSSSNATFDSRGRCPAGGEAVLEKTNGSGDQKKININPIGLIKQE